MRKLAFATAVIFIIFNFVSSDKNGVLNSGFQQTNFNTQTASISNDANQIVPIITGRANLAQADGKVSF